MTGSLGLGFALSLLVGCAGSHTDAPFESACEPASRVHDEALAQALDQAPACESNADCVAMTDSAECEGLVEIHRCDLAVHKRVLELYDPAEVGERMCEAAGDAQYGCTLNTLCVPHGAPLCHAGACVFAAP
jgi:hypothetical protein